MSPIIDFKAKIGCFLYLNEDILPLQLDTNGIMMMKHYLDVLASLALAPNIGAPTVLCACIKSVEKLMEELPSFLGSLKESCVKNSQELICSYLSKQLVKLSLEENLYILCLLSVRLCDDHSLTLSILQTLTSRDIAAGADLLQLSYVAEILGNSDMAANFLLSDQSELKV